ncbi:Uncharacterized protein with RING-type Zinc finger [Cryptosporidium hominis]|uniref:Uncharacterized protein with RING-type Zinc finger n=1 Tax=Cryptosporidium hominis TaxID=237895 RepID=A0ABX5BAM8_CRYHO|nr:Uncharacterized protein with RING-type Zinc finger [Cryptosporidium hominis]|eukprot:PPS94152.1 Uncharacterized protein with RING-type Zinc finger [Cryptosporidium hominis]
MTENNNNIIILSSSSSSESEGEQKRTGKIRKIKKIIQNKTTIEEGHTENGDNIGYYSNLSQHKNHNVALTASSSSSSSSSSSFQNNLLEDVYLVNEENNRTSIEQLIENKNDDSDDNEQVIEVIDCNSNSIKRANTNTSRRNNRISTRTNPYSTSSSSSSSSSSRGLFNISLNELSENTTNNFPLFGVYSNIINFLNNTMNSCNMNNHQNKNQVIEKPVELTQEEKEKAAKFTCPICLEDWDNIMSRTLTINQFLPNIRTPVVITRCGHHFCLNCAGNLVQRKQKCPRCRRNLTKKDFINFYV